MSIVKAGDNQPSTEGRRYSWESDQTLVQRRKTPLARIRRLFGFWRVVIVGSILLVLLNADVALWLRGWMNQAGETLQQFYSFNIQTLPVFFIQVCSTLAIAIGQFALIFWFLGRARTYTIWPGGANEGVSFKDYRGHPELLEQAMQIVKLLRGVRVFEESGGEPLNGLLLEGPPGTGKTWMAQAISTEAGVPFFYMDASSLNSMFFGIAPMKVMNLYRKARTAARDYGAAIIFLDEIDAVGSRGGVPTVTRDGDERSTRLPIMFAPGGNMGLLSALLTEMDGFSAEHGAWAKRKRAFYKFFFRREPKPMKKRLLTIGATNRVSALDAALLRAGRFDKKIRVDLPDMEGRRDIIDYYLSKIEHDDSMDPTILAAETPYYSPADIKYVLNESLRYALFQDRTYITYEDFRRAQPEHEFGLRTPIKNLAPEDKYRLAAHEAGHALAIRLYRPHYRIGRITIIRQGGAHGYVLSYPALEEFDYMSTLDELTNNLRVSIGGKAGEMEFVGTDAQTLGVGVGWGDPSDFGNIRATLWRMANAGMFGPLGANLNGTNYPPEMVEAMENLLQNVFEEVRLMFRLHKEMGEALIRLLLEKEELLSDEVEAFFDQYGLYTPKVQLPAPREQAASKVH